MCSAFVPVYRCMMEPEHTSSTTTISVPLSPTMLARLDRLEPDPKAYMAQIISKIPLSKPTTAAQPSLRELVFLPRSGHSAQQKSEFLEG